MFCSYSIYSQCLSGTISSYTSLFKTTGNQILDSKFNSEKSLIEGVFNISVDLWLMNDGNNPNALANCESRDPYSFNGTVRFGVTLLRDELYTMSKGEYAVAGILAHEFAHVLQCVMNCPLQARNRELQADFLAGYYLGRKSYFYSSNIRSFAISLFDKGDWYDPSHHGTPTERVNSMVDGFNSRNLTLKDAYKNSLNNNQGDSRTKIPCQHKIACQHQVPCQHRIPCQHQVPCQHQIPCQHMAPCQHIVYTQYVPQRAHQYDLLHQFDFQHQYDLLHQFDCQHQNDLLHQYDLLHEYDYI